MQLTAKQIEKMREILAAVADDISNTRPVATPAAETTTEVRQLLLRAHGQLIALLSVSEPKDLCERKAVAETIEMLAATVKEIARTAAEVKE